MSDRAAIELLSRVSDGDSDAARELMPLVYDRLRELAQSYFLRERAGHTLQPTALVNEAFVQLAHRDDRDWAGRTHFFAIASSEMRRILVDHARQKRAVKRGGDRQRVTLDGVAVELAPQIDAIALDEALASLSEIDARAARVVELRFFGGLTVDEVAAILGVTSRTVRHDWRAARAWLLSELEEREGDGFSPVRES